MNKHLGIAAVVAAGILMTAALPAPVEAPALPPDPVIRLPHPKLKDMDTNHDGMVSHEEFRAGWDRWVEEAFKKLDRNGDGVISAADGPKQRVPPPKRGSAEEPDNEL